MPYGVDLTDCRFTTDCKGNRLRADIPYNLFSMLVEFRQAALRAQTQQTENSTRPGIYKGSLISISDPATVQPPVAIPTQEVPKPGRASQQSEGRQRLEALFDYAPIPEVKPASVQSGDMQTSVESPRTLISSVSNRGRPARSDRHIFFPREFLAPIPDEIANAIANGTYFLRAWREYRQYRAQDAAELMSLKVATILCHEQGYNAPSVETLKRFLDIYDCSLEVASGIRTVR